MPALKRYKFSREIHPDIFRITLPLLAERPGPVHSFLFIGDSTTLLDAGTLLSSRRLKKALAELRLKFADIETILLSHGHPDHYGTAGRIVRASRGKTRVAIHREDLIWIESGFDAPPKTYADFYRLTGIPMPLRIVMQTFDLSYAALVKPLNANLILNDGEMIRLGNYSGKVLSTPGHSKGSICIYLEEEGLLFAGDTVLDHITPNAFVMFEEDRAIPLRRSQQEYYRSLARIEALSPEVTWPAHGRPIHDLKTVLESYRATYIQRQTRILEIVAQKTLTVYEIARRLFPEITGPGKLLVEIYPMISEVYTHLQVLEEEGRVALKTDHQPWRFYAKGPKF